MNKKITVVNSGWIFLGLNTVEDNCLIISQAENIRQWGTSEGLGQIAMNGKTKNTIADPYGLVKVPLNQVLFTIDCDYA